MSRFNLNSSSQETVNNFVTAATPEKIRSYISKQQVFYMDAYDMEEISEMVYGQRIEMLESPNDTTHQFNVTNNPLDKYEQEYVTQAVKNGHLQCWAYRYLLCDLCIKGFVEPGKYFLRMSW